MSVTAIVGAQWGDEGKGRIIDYLAQEADVVIRFQGGDNAGHTVIKDAVQVDRHYLPPGYTRHLVDPYPGRDRRIVDQHIDAAELRNNSLYNRRRISRNITRNSQGRTTICLQLCNFGL